MSENSKAEEMKDKKTEVSFKSCAEVTHGAEVFLFILLGSDRVRVPWVRGQSVGLILQTWRHRMQSWLRKSWQSEFTIRQRCF